MENKNHIELDNVLPADIEARSFEIIRSELPHPVPDDLAPVIIRAMLVSVTIVAPFFRAFLAISITPSLKHSESAYSKSAEV